MKQYAESRRPHLKFEVATSICCYLCLVNEQGVELWKLNK